MSASEPATNDHTGMPKVGDRIADRYVVIRLVGQGGFASVFEAKDEKAGGRVALKVLSSEKSVDFKFAARFEQEIRIVRELGHPNTIKIFDLGTTSKGLLYAVMEYAEGVSLDEDLFQHGPMSRKRALKIGSQLLKGLAEAHAHGIVHRDLKPENIMLCRIAGEDDFVKILDFGIAKSLVEELSLVRTQTGVVMGTPGYASPEVLMGEAVTPAADVYAAGLIFAEMLTGMPVVQGESVADVLVAQMSLTPEAIVADLPEGTLRRVIAKAVVQEAADRYPDAKAMLDDLRAGGKAAATAPMAALPGGPGAAPRPRASSRTTDVMGGGAPTGDLGDLLAEAKAQPPAEATTPAAFPPLVSRRPEPPKTAVSPTVTDELDRAMARATRQHDRRLLLLLLALLLGGAVAVTLILADLGREPEPIRPSAGAPEREPERAAPTPTQAVAMAEPLLEAEWAPLPTLPGPSAEGLSWDWLADAGGADVDAVAVLRGETASAEPEREVERPPTMRAYLIESARVNQRAIELLQGALREEQVTLERVPDSSTQLLVLYETLISQLLEADLCAAAQRRLDHAQENLSLLGDEAPTRLGVLQAGIDECLPSRPAGVAEWNPRRFLRLVARAGALYREASSLTAGAGAELQRTSLLEEALADFEEARELLLTALDTVPLSVARRAEIETNMDWLDARIITVRAALDQCAAAELHFDEAFGDVEVAEGAEPDPVITRLETELLACRGRSLIGTQPFEWALFRQLVDLSAMLYARAVALREPEGVGLRVTSEPPGARVTVSGRVIGRTPIDRRLVLEQGRVTLTLRLDGFKSRRLRVDVTGEDIVEHVVLEQDNPFGRVDRIGGD